MHRLTRTSLLAALLLVPAFLLLRHQWADPAASPDPAALTPTSDSGPSPLASPHEVMAEKTPDEHGDRVDVGALLREDEVMAGPEPDSLYPELKLASLQQARDQDLPVRLPVPHHQTGQVERVNSYAADQVSATGTLTGTHLRFRLNRLGQTTSVELQDAATGRFQTWLSQGDALPILMPAAEGEDRELNCDVHELEPELASAAGGAGADFRAVHPPPVDGAAHAPFLVQSQNLASAAATPVIDVAVGWYPAALEELIPNILRSLGRSTTPAAVREYLLAELYADFDYANESLENSDIDLRFNPLLVSELPAADYIDNGSGGAFLRALRDPADGRMDDFLREATVAGADIFTAVVGGGLGIGGIAFLSGRHSIVSVTSTILRNNTYIHEWGHNMGCAHTRAEVQISRPDGYDPDGYNYAWTFEELGPPPFSDAVQLESWSTLMGSGTEDNTLAYFSNPDSRYVHPTSGTSHALGNAENDNRRVVRENFSRLVNRNTVPVAPAITSQPASSTVDEGDAASFSVTATGTTLIYRWRKDGRNLARAGAATYEIASVVPADAGDYTVVVSNSVGSVTSSVATLTVVVAPAITSQPAPRTVDEGDAASFSVAATGTAPLTYQWRRNGSDIAGATMATYAIASAQPADAGNYTVVVSNSAGSVTSSVATLTVVVAPAITSPPTSRTVDEGDSASFSVVATGTTPFAYQWRKDGNAIVGASSATYEISSAGLTDAGAYSVAVSNSAGTVTSSAATLTVNAVAPAITTQPSARTISVGGTATFSVTATGTAPLGYQWRKDGSAIVGATAATYRIARAALNDAGTYSVVVSNGAGNVTSSGAILAVLSLRLTSFTVSPAFRSNNSMNVTIRASVTDGDSVGIEYVLRTPNGTSSRGSVVRVGGGEYAASIPLTNSPFVRGEWEITSVTLTAVTLMGDIAVTYSYEDLAAAGFDNGFFAGPPPTFKVQPPDVSAAAGFWMEVDVQVNHTLVQDRNDDTRAFPVNAWHLVLDNDRLEEPKVLQSDTSVYTNFADAVAARLLFGPITASDTGNFRIRATNPFGSVDSESRKLTVDATVSERAVHVGERTILSAPSTTIGVFRYQWLKDGFDIPGATASDYAIDPIRLDDAGLYSLRITDPYLRNSLVHRLRLKVSHPPVAPAITSQPVATSVVEGDSASFSVTASGDAPLSYQWSRDGSAIAGATSSTYEIAAAGLADAGAYSVVVSNAVGNVISSAATLTVNAVAPTITGQPASATVVEGSAVSFSIMATGTEPFTYQWSRNGIAIAGATAATYAIAGAQLADAGNYAVAVSNAVGSATSSVAVLMVTARPTITGQPASATVVEGEAASFSVVATGTAPFTYQWSRNGTAIVGATDATYDIAAARPNDAGSYTVTVTNEVGSVTSSAAVLTVTEAPEIVYQPASASVEEGSAVRFSVLATGTAPLVWQWSKDGSPIVGATDATYDIAAARPNDAGSYAVTVTNEVGSVTSSAAVLTVTEASVAPEITTQPAAMMVVEGDAASFGVVATGTAPLSYQWSRDGTAIAGATSSTYAIAGARPNDAGSYAVTVSNEVGSVTSSAAVLTVTEAPVALEIASQPAAMTVEEGDTARFTVKVTGTAPLFFEWFRNGISLPGVIGPSGPSLVITDAGLDDAGTYTVTVTNEVGSVTSAAAVLTVTEAPVAPEITSQPAAMMVVEGDAASFSVVATGTAPLTYQWSRDGSAIAGATSSTYEIAGAWPNDAGSYSVEVSNEVGSVTSAAAVLTVTEAPVAPEITAQPAATTVVEGDAASFSVVATGTAPLTWQWSRDGTEISGATDSTYAIAAAWPNDAGSYVVVVSNEAGSATSAAAVLTVTEASSALSNISVRTTLVESQVLVMGAVVSGGSKRLLIRAAGPALEAIAMGLNGLPDPQITLYDSPSAPDRSPAVIGENDDWDNALVDTFAAAGAFPFSAHSKDSAYMLEEARGAFTVHVSGKNGSGIVLVEAYDRSIASGARLTNVSARNFAGTGNDTFIAGFVISGTVSSRMLIRAIGPGLADRGVPDTLIDPVLTIFNSEMEAILSNDDWDSELAETFESVGAFPLLDASKDAALVDDLAPGKYTVQVLGADGGVGEALIEVYEVRAP